MLSLGGGGEGGKGADAGETRGSHRDDDIACFWEFRARRLGFRGFRGLGV